MLNTDNVTANTISTDSIEIHGTMNTYGSTSIQGLLDLNADIFIQGDYYKSEDLKKYLKMLKELHEEKYPEEYI